MTDFFVSGFVFTDITWYQILIGAGLGVFFGAVWYTAYWTDILRRPWSWAILAGSLILTWSSISFIQIPLQVWTGRALSYFWDETVLVQWILLAGIPQILLSGLVQEGSKLLPVVILWWKKGKNITPRFGLIAGAVAGLGFGVFEAIWVHLTVLGSNWSWETFKINGFIAAIPFVERFFVVAFHTASSAIAGWGLSKGWGWQFYLIASFAHAVINYSAVLFQSGSFDQLQLEIFIIIWALIVTSIALFLRYSNPGKSLKKMN